MSDLITATVTEEVITATVDKVVIVGGAYNGYTAGISYINTKTDLPTAVSGVITLEDNIAYMFTSTVDLLGDRLLCGENTVILGTSSENCRIKSTGLTDALITSQYSLPIRNITLEAALVFDLSGDGVTTALDWFGVNLTDCAVIGTIENYTNFIMQDCAFLNSAGLTFDGTIGTIGISSSLLDCRASGTAIILPATLTVSRRFRVIYSSFVVLAGEVGVSVNASATIPTESYILDNVNFSGGGTYISGVDQASNKALFTNCVGIVNTSANGQVYMQNNATATVVAGTNTFYKVSGTTTASVDNAKFTATNNRLTCTAKVPRKYHLSATLSFTSGNNNVCEFGFYDSSLGAIRQPSRTKSTANVSGRAENITLSCVAVLEEGDYIEVHAANTSATSNITVSDMNFILLEV